MDAENHEIPLIDKLLTEQPLHSRLRVSAWFSLVNFITEAGFRENKMWPDDDSELELALLLSKYCTSIADDFLKEKEEWEKDGKPESKNLQP